MIVIQYKLIQKVMKMCAREMFGEDEVLSEEKRKYEV